ncbi:MAG: hypothetical protein QM790_19190 [Nibricoccus sp.]
MEKIHRRLIVVASKPRGYDSKSRTYTAEGAVATGARPREIKTDDLSSSWDELVEAPARAAGFKPPFLKVVHSPYREFFGPLVKALKAMGEEYPDRVIAVMLPEIVERRWYHFLFRHRATLLKAFLLMRGGPRIVLITTPWYRHDDRLQEEMRQPQAKAPLPAAVVDDAGPPT